MRIINSQNWATEKRDTNDFLENKQHIKLIDTMEQRKHQSKNNT